MRKFETGKRYGEHAVVFEITKRTAKTITYAAVYHAGRNRKRRKQKSMNGTKEKYFLQEAKW